MFRNSRGLKLRKMHFNKIIHLFTVRGSVRHLQKQPFDDGLKTLFYGKGLLGRKYVHALNRSADPGADHLNVGH